METKLICPICGSPTREYMGNARKDKLCGKHADLLKKGEIEVNDKGLFIDNKTKEILNKSEKVQKLDKGNKPAEKEEAEDLAGKCLACGKPTRSEYFFCKTCYSKYKNKELLVKIKNCTDIEILDESYEGHYVCDDGHIVKSKSEREIDNYLFANNIPHAYEKAFIPDYDYSIKLEPDFTLPNFAGEGKDVILEHWGFTEENIDYHKTKKYKLQIYKKAGVTLICTNEKDMNDYKVALKRKLNTYVVGKINFDE
jgi:hypothetical protein